MRSEEDKIMRGIRFLDKQGPKGWEDCIDLKYLDLSHKCDCVLGQLYGSFLTGRAQLGLSERDAGLYGFQAHEISWHEEFSTEWQHARADQYAALTEQWIDAITELREERHQA